MQRLRRPYLNLACKSSRCRVTWFRCFYRGSVEWSGHIVGREICLGQIRKGRDPEEDSSAFGTHHEGDREAKRDRAKIVLQPCPTRVHRHPHYKKPCPQGSSAYPGSQVEEFVCDRGAVPRCPFCKRDNKMELSGLYLRVVVRR